MLNWRNIRDLAAGLVLLLALIPPGHAQDAGEAPAPPPEASSSETAPAPAPAPVENKALAAFSEALDQWTSQLEAQEQAISEDATTDDELREIPDLLEALREAILEKKGQLRPKLVDARERLAKLGPAPEDGAPTESPEIAAQRKRLESEVSAIDGKIKQADILFVRAGQLIDQANDERRNRFTKALFRPVPSFYVYVLPQGFERVPRQAERTVTTLSSWFARAWDTSPLVLILLVIAPLSAGAAMRGFVRNMAARIDAKQAPNRPAEPTIQDCGTWALRKTVRAALPVWAGLIVFYLIATSAGLTEASEFLYKATLSAGWAVLLMALITHTLLPDEPELKVLPIEDAVAKRLAVLGWATVAVWLAEQIWALSDTVVYTPYPVSVLRSAVFAALYGVLFLAMTLSVPRQDLSGWRRGLFLGALALSGLIIVAMLFGYEQLARFVGAHAISTAGVLWIMYLLHLAAESISSVSVIQGRTIDDELDEEEEKDAPSLLTLRIIVSILLDIAILLFGVTILLLLWRFDWVEVKGWIQAAFFGFQFGNLRISLQSVLIALGVFALGLVLTRFVQSWFTTRFFSGRRTDSGVKESARIGIGYLGFVLAALAGVSYLGVDFSNLAIVAGALSVGIGFGLQSIFNNFVSGLILLVERPIKIGDYIQVGDQEGTVKKISVRSTEIETIHRRSVIIPNATLITDPVVNWMHLDRSCRLDLPVGVDYDTDMELLRSTLLHVAEKHRNVLKSPPPVVHFAGFGDSSLDFELRVFLRDVGERVKSSSDLRFAILAALRAAGISIPFPQRDVHIKEGALPEDAADREAPDAAGTTS